VNVNLDSQKKTEYSLGKKQGKPMESSSDSQEEEEEESNPRSSPSIFKGARPSTDNSSHFDTDESGSDSSGFIVEDGGEGVALPARFSMETHQDLDYQFKKIFQFFVHIAVQPSKARKEFMKDQIRSLFPLFPRTMLGLYNIS
jgi:hypothetical protein